MASAGLHEALHGLRSRLDDPGRCLSTAFTPTPSSVVCPGVSAPKQCFNHRNDYAGERILTVTWVMGDNPAPFCAGSVLKIVYADNCVCLVDAQDIIRFAADLSAKDLLVFMDYLRQDTVKVLWSYGRLYLETDGGFRQGFISIAPVPMRRF